MKNKSIPGLRAIVIMAVVIAAATVAISTSTLKVQGQGTTTPQGSQNQTADTQQIKNYLTQAIQALDSGNNTKAAEQVGLAGNLLGGAAGAEVEDDNGKEEGAEEGPGEDVDEPGDTDTNDAEDKP